MGGISDLFRKVIEGSVKQVSRSKEMHVSLLCTEVATSMGEITKHGRCMG